jgi:inosine triphosphate pyrophosphatase
MSKAFLSTLFLADTRRFAEMDKGEKNKISHRGRALGKLQAWFKEQK